MGLQLLKGRTLVRIRKETVSSGGIVLVNNDGGAPFGIHQGEVVHTGTEEGFSEGDVILWKPHRARLTKFEGETFYLVLDDEIFGVVDAPT
jgi:co-chaperonin GroES (HSP10)